VTISTLLIANRGEIARRVIRGAHAMGIRCVAIFVDGDEGAPHVADADEATRLATSYLDAPAIVAAAKYCGADAVHPGYGFLSENAEFARLVEEGGLTWIGPPPHVIEAMGDKIAAKKLANAAGLATLPSSENVKDAKKIGYPLMVKSAAGGGGKGMRIVREAAQLSDAVTAAQREALSGFGDERVFLERYVARSRHIEVQILGDQHGNLVHLGERECSIQRRHQKLIEESPSSIVDDAMRAAMGSAAIELARSIGYHSTGTVEFLVDDETREFYFLEVNTRLQVEHPVTEAVTGIDLVREQLRVANGETLGYEQDDVHVTGSAIEARLCAEDAVAGFLPAIGTLVAFDIAEEPSVRWDTGVGVGSSVTVAFDPLLAKVIAHAPTRGEAAATLALALERLHLGGVTTNRDFLVATLRHEGFLAGDTTTDFIERHAPERAIELSDDDLALASTAAALWLQGENRAAARVLSNVPSGWRNARLPRQSVTLRRGDLTLDVRYRMRRDGSFDVGEHDVARIHRWSPSDIDIEVNGRRRTSRVTHAGAHLHVQVSRGTVDFTVVPRFVAPGAEVTTGGLSAPMPGVVIEVRVHVGQRVEVGETLVVLEAMKMEHVISAPSAGVVSEIFVSLAQQVDSGAVLLTIDDDSAATS